ncbi:carboxymuconolactone decarboxylase family protein, partial [Bombilactobacillus bombi]|uniref:carboxymuconolactone decarboxylase family protein n=1 Tax=Bombilactobacillus bombi TaxID=1303590 RepID=UPI0015E5F9F9
MVNYSDNYEKFAQETKVLREQSPAEMQAFGGLVKESLKSGALDTKTKEMIALGIAIADRCEGCIMSH